MEDIVVIILGIVAGGVGIAVLRALFIALKWVLAKAALLFKWISLRIWICAKSVVPAVIVAVISNQLLGIEVAESTVPGAITAVLAGFINSKLSGQGSTQA